MRRLSVLMVLMVATALAGCTTQVADQSAGNTIEEISVGESFLAGRTTEGGIARLESNIVRPGDRFLVVLRDVEGFEEDGDGGYGFDVGVEILSEPGGEEVYSLDDVAGESNEAIVDGRLPFTDVGITTPSTIEFGTYSVLTTVHDRIGNRSVTVEESLIVSAAEGEPG